MKSLLTADPSHSELRQEYVERANQMVKAQQSSDLQTKPSEILKPACAGSAVLGGGE